MTSVANSRAVKWGAVVIGLTVLLALICIVSLCLGSAEIPARSIPGIIMDGPGTVEYTAITCIRLPRVLLGIAVGGALSLAGVMLQGMFRNPLVEPYTLGISGGASVGVCLCIMLKLNAQAGMLSMPASGFLGAIAAVSLVYALSAGRNRLQVRDMLLTGVMISFICSSLVMLAMAVSEVEDLRGIVFWIMGSLTEPSRPLIYTALAVSLVALVVSYGFCMDLNALSLGEEDAAHLGVNVERTKRRLFLLSSLVTGLSVSVGGVIGFVGLVVPHFMRMIVGSDHRILLVTSFLAGGAFLVFCDTIARTVISPLELPVGVITGILGGGIFVYALSKGKQ